MREQETTKEVKTGREGEREGTNVLLSLKEKWQRGRKRKRTV